MSAPPSCFWKTCFNHQREEGASAKSGVAGLDPETPSLSPESPSMGVAHGSA